VVPGLIDGVLEDLADLSLSGGAKHRRHHPQQVLRAMEPRTDLELAEATVEAELDFQPSQCRSLDEHLALDLCRMVPHRLAVASRAKISRPRCPAGSTDGVAATLARKESMSVPAESRFVSLPSPALIDSVRSLRRAMASSVQPN